MPKAKLFSDADLLVMRRLYYEQAPTMAALIFTSEGGGTVEDVSAETVDLIEALIDAVAEVEL
jgi:hypothetical protein